MLTICSAEAKKRWSISQTCVWCVATEAFDVDLDLLPGRMNLTIEEGVVVNVGIEEDPGRPPTEREP